MHCIFFRYIIFRIFLVWKGLYVIKWPLGRNERDATLEILRSSETELPILKTKLPILGRQFQNKRTVRIKEEPRSLKNVAERLAQKTAKRLSMSSLKRLAKKARLRWKRVRKSLKSLRDPRAFAQCQRELEVLQKQEDQGRIDLYYFDEAGFTLDPYIPYAWQEPGTV